MDWIIQNELSERHYPAEPGPHGSSTYSQVQQDIPALIGFIQEELLESRTPLGRNFVTEVRPSKFITLVEL